MEGTTMSGVGKRSKIIRSLAPVSEVQARAKQFLH